MKIAIFGTGFVTNRIANDLRDLDIEPVMFASAFETRAELGECALAICTSSLSSLDLLTAVAGCLERGLPVVAACHGEESLEAISTLKEDATSADIAVVVGIGWSPGVTNLLAVMAYELLESPTSLNISWVLSPAGYGAAAALSRTVDSVSGTAVTFVEGAWVRAVAGQERERIFFPEPIGWKPVRLAAGIEALTLPTALPGLRNIEVRCGLTGSAANWLIRRASALTELASDGTKHRAGMSIASAVPLIGRLSGPSNSWSALRVDVFNEDESKMATFGCLDLFENFEAVPLVAAAQAVLAGDVKGTGVLNPEEAFEPKQFVRRIANRGLRIGRLDRGPRSA